MANKVKQVNTIFKPFYFQFISVLSESYASCLFQVARIGKVFTSLCLGPFCSIS